MGREDASISDLAERFGMTLTGVKKHVRVLEEVGLIGTRKTGRGRTVNVWTRRLDDVTHWIGAYQQSLDARLDRLESLLERLQREKPELWREDIGLPPESSSPGM